MRLTRPAVAIAVGVSLVIAGHAGAAVKKPKPKPKPVPPVCNLVTDPAGDATGSFIATGVFPFNEDAVDIVSGDVATNAKNLTTVIRVKKLATSSPTAPDGLHWKFWFTINGTAVYTQAVSPVTGAPTFVYGQIDPTTGSSKSLGAVTGTIDLAKNEVRVTVPLQSLPDVPKAGSKIGTFAPNAGRYFAAGVSLSDSTDEATSEKTYTVGAPSCVKVGT